MSKDLSRDKQSDKYFDAQNVRILATDDKTSLSITNEKGNSLVFSIPTPVINLSNTSIDYDVNGVTKSLVYKTTSGAFPRCQIEEEYIQDPGNTNTPRVSGQQKIIGVKELRTSAIILTTDDNGFDCFWELTGLDNDVDDLNLLYMNNLGMSTENLCQILFNYENSIIQKIYFVDGKNQFRFFNIKQSVDNGDNLNLVDVPPSSIDAVGTFDLSQIKIDGVVGGGGHTSGVIQYAYSLYVLNGGQTAPSPLSELVPIGKGQGLGGGDVNEVLGKSVVVSIPKIDENYTNIKLFSIKYTSFNQTPEIQLIADREIDNFNSFTYTDDGIGGTSVSVSEFAFLGSNPVVPEHIAAKDNRLFAFNIKEKVFDVDLDTRCYSFNSGSQCKVRDNAFLDENSVLRSVVSTVTAPDYILPTEHDAINFDYNEYKYQSNGSVLGASGKYIDVEMVQTQLPEEVAEDRQFFKDREIYRLGIKFYNRRGQTSLPKWMCDVVAPEGNLSGNYNSLKVTLNADFYVWLNTSSNFKTEDDKPVGYKILRADRKLSDQTIVAQGYINPMVANFPNKSGKKISLSERQEAALSQRANKMPSITRTFNSITPFIGCKDFHELAWSSINDSNLDQLGRSKFTEGFKAKTVDEFRAQTFQFNKLMQFFSPEILFRDFDLDSGVQLNVVGLVKESFQANWSAEVNVNTGNIVEETKFLDGFNSSTPGVSSQPIVGSPSNLSDKGFYSATDAKDARAEQQVYREFDGDIEFSSGQKLFDIYGKPEIAEVGADYKSYNNDFSLKYANNLKTMLLDRFDDASGANSGAEVTIQGMNTVGARCVVFAEGPDDPNYPNLSRRSIEKIKQNSGIVASNGVLISEFVRPDYAKYVGNVYGGFSYEAKRSSSYIEIGSYQSIDVSFIDIESPGDTFVGLFVFSKMARDPLNIASTDYNVISEIVGIRVETTVDLKNRNDLSISEWDNRRQPLYDEYQNYNTVYSQQPNLLQDVDQGSNTKTTKEFDSRIIASKVKTPGESIDSWTDLLENETLDLDGKYGPINAVINFKDFIFAAQDNAVALISINPRVQQATADGIGLELGTGRVLSDYKYLTTNSGCLNKFGMVEAENSFYYMDILNRSIMQCNGQSVVPLSDIKGFHYDLRKKINSKSLREDNHVLRGGIISAYNPVNKDVYFTFGDATDKFTLVFNEKAGEFTSFYSYKPQWYLNKGLVMITTGLNNDDLWQHFRGNTNEFYGVLHESSITFHIASDTLQEMVLNNAGYRLEMYDGETPLPFAGLSKVNVSNERQNSGDVPLVLRNNVTKSNGSWSINLPRNKESRERIRSSWGFIKLILDNPNFYDMVLHDVSVYYTEH